MKITIQNKDKNQSEKKNTKKLQRYNSAVKLQIYSNRITSTTRGCARSPKSPKKSKFTSNFIKIAVNSTKNSTKTEISLK